MKRFSPFFSYAFASRGTDRGLLMNVLKSAAEFYAFEDSASSACVSVSEAGRSCFASVKRRYYLRALCTVLLKPTAHIIQSDLETFHTCVLNLLTDIETLALSSSSSDVHAHTGVADNEIALLVDECLALLSSTRNPQASLLYRAMFESWIGSSKDSPILLSLISRLSSHTTLLLAASTSETYFGLLELCLEVFFETSRPSEQTWHLIISNVHLIGLSSSSSSPSDETSEPFELSCLQHSAYLLLHAYMCVHLNDWQAKVASSASSINSLLDYSMQIINAFLVVDAATKAPRSRPKAAAGKEAKFIVILKKLVHTLLVVMQHATQFAYANQLTIQEQRQIESRVGEQIVKLANLLVYYGEDTLSSQSPLNRLATDYTLFYILKINRKLFFASSLLVKQPRRSIADGCSRLAHLDRPQHTRQALAVRARVPLLLHGHLPAQAGHSRARAVVQR